MPPRTEFAPDLPADLLADRADGPRTGIGPAPVRTISGPGCVDRLPEQVDCSNQRVTIVATPRVIDSVPAVRRMIAAGACSYDRIRPNPTTDEVRRLMAFIAQTRPEVIVAIGGGSAIDLAKAARIVRPGLTQLDGALAGRSESLRPQPPTFVVVPTTAGTGSEQTTFATLYRNHRKVSLDTPAARPDLALLDGGLIAGTPAAVAFAAHLDALCHAVESCWSRAATDETRRWCWAAIAELLSNPPDLPDYRDPDRLQRRLLAASAAGVAIDRTRTTAAHAFSYWLTEFRGVPHGFACATAMRWIAPLNADLRARAEPGFPDLLDRLAAPISEIGRLLDLAAAHRWYSPPVLGPADLRDYINASLSVRNRADNNPVPLEYEDVLVRLTRSTQEKQ